jgi:hypothetical protein
VEHQTASGAWRFRSQGYLHKAQERVAVSHQRVARGSSTTHASYPSSVSHRAFGAERLNRSRHVGPTT